MLFLKKIQTLLEPIFFSKEQLYLLQKLFGQQQNSTSLSPLPTG